MNKNRTENIVDGEVTLAKLDTTGATAGQTIVMGASAPTWGTAGTATTAESLASGNGTLSFTSDIWTFTGDIQSEVRADYFSGDGSLITGIADSALSANVPLKNGDNTFTGNNSFTGGLTFAGLAVASGKTLTVSKTMTLTSSDDTSVITLPSGTKTLLATDGSAANLTAIPAAQVTGAAALPDAVLSTNVPLKNGANTFTNANTFQPGAAYDTAALGAEILDATTWTLGAGWAYVSGSDWTQGFQHTAGNTATLEQTDTCTTGNYYKVAWTISGRTAGSIGISYGGMGTSGQTASGNFTLKASTTGNLIITPTTDFNGTVILSVLPVTAYDAALVVKDTVGDVDVEVRSSTKTLNNLYIGRNTGKWNTNGYANVGIGPEALASISSGDHNTAVGYNALGALQYGRYNTAIGSGALRQITYGAYNIGIGYYAGNGITTHSGNVYIGWSSGNTAGGNNVGVGYQSLYSGGTSCVAIGYAAGKYASSVTGGFYVNNKDQGNAEAEKSNSLLYGVMGASATAQTLQVAGKLKVDPSAGTYAAPTEALDVVGNIKASGGVTANTFPLIQWRGSSASDPTENLTEGQMYFNNMSGVLKIYTGSAWVIVGAGP